MHTRTHEHLNTRAPEHIQRGELALLHRAHAHAHEHARARTRALTWRRGAQAKLAFLYSQTLRTNDAKEISHGQSVTFIEFLEALARVADMLYPMDAAEETGARCAHRPISPDAPPPPRG